MTGETTASGPGSVAAQTVSDSTITTNVNLPPPPAPPSARRQLPGDLPEFTGRAAELLALTTALDRDSGATVAITALRGMGGVGKTTLAQHAARRLTHRYPDAQIVVDLNGHGVGAPTTPIDAMQRVIRAFTPTLPPLDDVTQARAIYRDTLNGKRVLILLDNAADTDQIRDLIPPPCCGALITARELVQPPGCTVLRLDLLPLDESVALLRALAPATAGEDTDWRRLADRCGLLPLALRVAGSVLATAEDLTLPGYLAELADEATRPHRLTVDGDASANVAAVLSHSLRRLVAQAPALAARWQILSVFPADFDRAAAAAVWEESTDNAAPILRGLLARSLLFYDKARDRYHLHDLMRPLARSLFEHDPDKDPTPGTTDRITAAAGRFAMHFLGVLNEANKLYMRGHSEVVAGLSRYDTEARNIASAAAWAITLRESDPTAQHVAVWLPNAGVYVLNLRLPQRELIVWLTAATTIARRMGKLNLAANHLSNLGNAHADLGEIRHAIGFYQQALVISREIGDRRNEGAHLGNLGNAHAALGETRRAIDFYQQSLAIAREIGDKNGEETSLGNLGNRYAELGETRRAIDFHQQALAIAQEIGNRLGEGNHLGNLGNRYAELGETRRAIDFNQQALDISREIGDRRGEGQDLGNLGNAHAALGETRRAIGFYQQALTIAQEIGDRYGEGNRLGNLGRAHAALGETRLAIDFHQQALAIAQEIGDRRSEGNHLYNLGDERAKQGDVHTAIALTEQALAIFVAIESPKADQARQQLARLRGDAPQG
ncbi:tetratricopeptide repeat protein [Azospirillum sp.]|uniref:tetratricopeptide repeat protein n=1 Tax=Azospirillum sp. TaxID=34012 RepID=UPI00261B68DD|nr:tetratricopeptide repeat protein [Azospirillum sp.]